MQKSKAQKSFFRGKYSVFSCSIYCIGFKDQLIRFLWAEAWSMSMKARGETQCGWNVPIFSVLKALILCGYFFTLTEFDILQLTHRHLSKFSIFFPLADLFRCALDAGHPWFVNSLGSWERSARREKGAARRKPLQGADTLMYFIHTDQQICIIIKLTTQRNTAA